VADDPVLEEDVVGIIESMQQVAPNLRPAQATATIGDVIR
jgi:hypothetical protein